MEKNTRNIILVGMAIVLLLFAVVGRKQVVNNLAGYEDITRKGDGVYATSTQISNALAAGGKYLALTSTPGVAYRRLENITNIPVACRLDDATSTLTFGGGTIYLAGIAETGGESSFYEMTLDNLYWGPIYCLASSSTSTINVIQW